MEMSKAGSLGKTPTDKIGFTIQKMIQKSEIEAINDC